MDDPYGDAFNPNFEYPAGGDGDLGDVAGNDDPLDLDGESAESSEDFDAGEESYGGDAGDEGPDDADATTGDPAGETTAKTPDSRPDPFPVAEESTSTPPIPGPPAADPTKRPPSKPPKQTDTGKKTPSPVDSTSKTAQPTNPSSNELSPYSPYSPYVPRWPSPSGRTQPTTETAKWPSRSENRVNDQARTWPQEFDQDSKPLPIDPNRPNIQSGDWSIWSVETPEVSSFDPKSQLPKTIQPIAGGVTIHFGGDSRSSAPTRRNEPKRQRSNVGGAAATDAASNGLPQDASQAPSQVSPPVTTAPVQETIPSAPARKRVEPSIPSKPLNTSSARDDGKTPMHSVTVVPGDAFTAAVTPDFVLESLQDGGQTAVDGIESAARSLRSALEWLAPTVTAPPETATKRPTAPSASPSQAKTPAKPVQTPEQRQRSAEARRQQNAAKAAARQTKWADEWEREVGGRFQKQRGARPTDPQKAADWDAARRRAIDGFGRRKENPIELKSSEPENGIRA